MDIATGKTTGTAYVEVMIKNDLGFSEDAVISSIVFQPVQGRRIKFVKSTYGELCRDLFSAWRPGFTDDGLAILPPGNGESGAGSASYSSAGNHSTRREGSNGGATTITTTTTTTTHTAMSMTDDNPDTDTDMMVDDLSTFFIEQKDIFLTHIHIRLHIDLLQP
ncbi:hypothetical protein BDF20DRAFT_855172 [Mycotypha africana]|uniref:uncharacterized protein n=1 Tax=Mycotypha africana TaxID=64632 RepID=UPI0022FFE69B|nr:uncharacterized protein BDF20DRAFT_855172 [Mycotypha africana]KAI8988332.1 hypothetical protein BDF20DRAFT_855172 [Mycotypha africana]